jgi:hypothetical protein
MGFVDRDLRATRARTITWRTSYPSAEWVRLLGTHSDHRMLPDDVRRQLHTEIGAAIDDHGGVLDAIYDVRLSLATCKA